jgi:hypothetical protein
MAHLTVTISRNAITYDPPGKGVNHGDTVFFVLHDYKRGTRAVVSFLLQNCFTLPGTFRVDGADEMPAVRTVSSRAKTGTHPFQVWLYEPGPKEDSAPEDPTDRKSGGIDVTGDPREPALR